MLMTGHFVLTTYVLLLLPKNIYTNSKGEFLLATSHKKGRIYKISLDTDLDHVVALNLSGLQAPTGITYDRNHSDIIYVANSPSKTVQRCSLTTTNCTLLFTAEGYLQRLAMDYSSGNIYYTANINPSLETSRLGYISIFNPRGNIHRKLIYGLGNPGAITLFPSRGLMFLADRSDQYPHIGSVLMNGDNRKDIVTHGVIWPKGLVIDYGAERIYWSDSFYDRIESSDLDGSNRAVHLANLCVNIGDLVISSDYMYYLGWNNNKITKLDKNYNIIKVLSDRIKLRHIETLSIYPAIVHPINKDCFNNNGNCIEFCLPVASSYVCQCDENSQLNTDNRTCSRLKNCNATLSNGRFSATCKGKPGTKCKYECNSGFSKQQQLEQVSCQHNGNWDVDIEGLCERKEFEDSTTSEMTIVQAGIVGGIVGTVVSFGCLVVTVMVYRCIVSKRVDKKRQNLKHITNPHLSSKGYITATDMNSSIYSEIDNGTVSTVLSSEECPDSIGCPSCSPSPPPRNHPPHIQTDPNTLKYGYSSI